MHCVDVKWLIVIYIWIIKYFVWYLLSNLVNQHPVTRGNIQWKLWGHVSVLILPLEIFGIWYQIFSFLSLPIYQSIRAYCPAIVKWLIILQQTSETYNFTNTDETPYMPAHPSIE